jgi:hypothetical protein
MLKQYPNYATRSFAEEHFLANAWTEIAVNLWLSADGCDLARVSPFHGDVVRIDVEAAPVVEVRQ